MDTSNVHTLMDMVIKFIPTVFIAYNNLLASDGFYENIRLIKANHRATYFVEKAKQMLSDGDTRLASEYFTRAITFAENGSNKLLDCYIERAHFLKGLDYWIQACEDIWRTIRCRMINVDLDTFFEVSQNSLGTERIVRVYSPPIRELPRIPDYEVNKTFPCSTTNIRIVKGETKGQRVVATSRLHISENIVVEKPLVLAPGEYESTMFCHDCLSFCLNPVPCSSCSRVAFCGEVCKESAWRRYHKYECYIQYIIDRYKQYRLVVKIALLFHDYIDLREDGSHCPEGYRYIMNKEYNLEDYSDEAKNVFALFAAQVYHGLRKYTTFFEDIEIPEKYDIFKGLMMKLMLVVNKCQQKFIRSYYHPCERTMKTFTVSCMGLYPFSSNFRTGCAPNVSSDYTDTFRVVKTLRVIQPGEELFIAGNYHYTITPKEERQAIFQYKYSTVCKCEACENNWPLGRDLERSSKSDVSFKLHMSYKRMDIDLSLGTSVERLHATIKDHIGVDLAGPSLEWLIWQKFLVKAHQRLCGSCEKIQDFFRRRHDSR